VNPILAGKHPRHDIDLHAMLGTDCHSAIELSWIVDGVAQ
jgi:hypothetical protein